MCLYPGEEEKPIIILLKELQKQMVSNQYLPSTCSLIHQALTNTADLTIHSSNRKTPVF